MKRLNRRKTLLQSDGKTASAISTMSTDADGDGGGGGWAVLRTLNGDWSTGVASVGGRSN